MVKRLDDDKLKFNEEKHEYRVGKRKLRSVTEWVGGFFGAFDEEAISKKVADKRGVAPEEVLAEWQESRDHGTKVHKEVEDWVNARAAPTEPKAKAAISFLLEQFPYFSSWYPEARVYSEELGLAGTIDFLMVEDDPYTKPRVTLIDWKTNKAIHKGNRWQQTGEGPVEHLHDSHFNKYSLQLSTYAFILEEEYGFLVDALYICHLTETGYKVMPVDYLRQTVKEMIYSGKE